jgi:hypothetical protein
MSPPGDEGRLVSPPQHFESNAREAVLYEAQCLCRAIRQIDEDTSGLRTLGRTAIEDAHLDRPSVRQVRDTDHRTKRVGRMSGDHGVHVESNAARRGLAIESRPVIRGEPLANFKNAQTPCRRCRSGRPGGATGKSQHQRWNHYPRDPEYRSLPFRVLLRHPNAGLRLPRKFVESRRPQLLDHPQRGSSELDQRRYVNPLTGRGKRLEMCRPAGEHVDDPMIVAALKVVEGHADLENALVQSSYGASLGAPE